MTLKHWLRHFFAYKWTRCNDEQLKKNNDNKILMWFGRNQKKRFKLKNHRQKANERKRFHHSSDNIPVKLTIRDTWRFRIRCVQLNKNVNYQNNILKTPRAKCVRSRLTCFTLSTIVTTVSNNKIRVAHSINIKIDIFPFVSFAHSKKGVCCCCCCMHKYL